MVSHFTTTQDLYIQIMVEVLPVLNTSARSQHDRIYQSSHYHKLSEKNETSLSIRIQFLGHSISMRFTVLFIVGFTWLCFSLSTSYVFGVAIAGPYDIKIESVGPCASKTMNGKNLLAFSSKMQRISRKKLLAHFNATFLTTLNDEQKILLNMAKKTSQGWKDNYFITEFKQACSLIMKTLPEIRTFMTKSYNIDKCPIPAGNYSITVDLNMETTKMIPVMEYGKNRARVSVRQDSDTLTCMEAFVEFVPQKRG